MVRRAWLLGFILIIPCIGFAVAEGIRAYFDSELRSALQKNYPGASSQAISQVSMDRLCEKQSSEVADVCTTNEHLRLMRTAALWAGGVGLALLLTIRFAGVAARKNRQLLLYLFKPGLYFTALVLMGLVLVHAAIAIAAIYYGESALIERVHVKIIALIGIGAVIGIVGMSRNIFSLVRKAQAVVIGKQVTRKEAPAIWEKVEMIAKKLGALSPERIVVGLEPNFFVTKPM
jgi:hypothetical protein